MLQATDGCRCSNSCRPSCSALTALFSWQSMSGHAHCVAFCIYWVGGRRGKGGRAYKQAANSCIHSICYRLESCTYQYSASATHTIAIGYVSTRGDSLSLLAMQAGAFRIGDTAGTLENIVACKLYRPGSVGFVSKSGGMSNEMYNVLSRATNGLYEGKPEMQSCLGRHLRTSISAIAGPLLCEELAVWDH